MPHEDDARQLCERLDDVEVAERTHFEEGHGVLLGVGASLLCGNLTLKRQVQPVPHQDPRNPGSMLQINKTQQDINTLSLLLQSVM